MICKLKHRWSSVWKSLFFKIYIYNIQEIHPKATNANVFNMLHSDDWQDHGTCDVYFAACGLVPTQRVCGHGNLRKTMQRSRSKHSLAAKTVAAEKKTAAQFDKADAKQHRAKTDTDLELSTQRQRKTPCIENYHNIRSAATATSRVHELDKHRLLDWRFIYCLLS